MSNLLDKASIILTPTAYNNGEALCVKPSDGSGDFDFSRNSAATRVNAQGLVENVQILSSNLVQNGDFSEEGAEEVSNGSFSQEGVELVTNGDFSNGSTGWNFQLGWTFDNGQAHFENLGSSNRNLWQSPLVNGNWYKLTFEITAITSGYIRNVNSSVTDDTQFSTIGVHTQYFQAANVNLYLKASVDANLSIDNVSCVEVGQDWVIYGTGWSFGEDKIVSVNGSNYGVHQSAIVSGKTYKITYEVKDYVSGNFSIRANTASGSVTASANGTYTDYITSNGTLLRLMGNGTFNGSVTNISAKEVGQNWTSEQGIWTFGDGVANGNGATGAAEELGQNLSAGGIAVGDKVKLSFEIKNYASGSVQVIGITPTSSKSANGVYEYIGEVTSLNFRMRGSSFNGSVTNISVIEITTDTNLPRINYENFSYQDALGSELVNNGTFDNGGSYWANISNLAVFENSSVIFENNARIYQNVVSDLSKEYKIEINFSNISVDGIKILAGNGNSFVNYSVNDIVNNNNKIVLKTNFVGSGIFFIYSSSSSTIATITNVSVKEVTGQEVVPDSGCGSWLFEPQSTNTLTNSNTVSTMNYSSNITKIDNSAISPDSTFNAMIFTPTATGGIHRSGYSSPAGLYAQNDIVTFSGFIKANGYDFVTMGGFFGQEKAVFNISNGTLVSQESNVINTEIVKLTNDWYRLSTTYTFQNGIGNGFLYAGIYVMDTETGYAFTGDGVSGVYGYGFQAELGTGTSYIPTSGSQVTRNQDVCNNGGSLASINSTEGVLYAEIAALSDSGSCQFGLFGNSTSQQLRLEISNSIIRAQLFNGAYQANMSSTQVVTNNNKIAFKYKENDFALWVNGVEVATDTIGVTFNPNELIKFNLTAQNNISIPFFGKTKAVAVWKEALSDQELTELTTI